MNVLGEEQNVIYEDGLHARAGTALQSEAAVALREDISGHHLSTAYSLAFLGGTTMTTTVDVIVLGTGSAAQTVAYACRSAGWRVAVVDSRPFGGTCENRGCEPKKVLASMAELVDWSRRTQGKGVSAPSLALNWPDLIH